MKNLTKLLLSLCIPFSGFISPAFAQGEITVEYADGETQILDVDISDTKEFIYFQNTENDNILMITKNKCDREGELIVCNKARAGLQSHGILEELNIEEIFLFINSSEEEQAISGSKVTMSPNTILLEFVTDKGSLITGLGTIDSNVRPENAVVPKEAVNK